MPRALAFHPVSEATDSIHSCTVSPSLCSLPLKLGIWGRANVVGFSAVVDLMSLEVGVVVTAPGDSADRRV